MGPAALVIVLRWDLEVFRECESYMLILVALAFAEKYFELLKERKVKGYLFQEKNYFSGEAGKSA